MSAKKPIIIAIMHGIGDHDKLYQDLDSYSKNPISKLQKFSLADDNPLKKSSIKIREQIDNLREKSEESGIFEKAQEFAENIREKSLQMKKSAQNWYEMQLEEFEYEGIQGMMHLIQKHYTKQGGMRELVFIPVHWAKELQRYEDELWKRMQQYKLGSMRVREIIVRILGDVIAYQPVLGDSSIYQSIHENIAQQLNEVIKDYNNAPIVVIAHSLGSVIAKNFIWELQNGTTIRNNGITIEQIKNLQIFYTMGSPLAIYGLRHCSTQIDPSRNQENDLPFGNAIKVPKWVNFYSKNDILAYPLANLNESYRAAGIEDIEVEVGGALTGWNAISHTKYWTDLDIIDRISTDLLKLNL